MSEAIERRLALLHPVIGAAQAARAVLFLSWTDGTKRASTITVSGGTIADAWARGIGRLREAGEDATWLRVDWVSAVEQTDWRGLRAQLARIKRNYFRLGIALDEGFEHAFLETELNANAMLYGGGTNANAILNEKNFRLYAQKRHGLGELEFANDDPVWVFDTRGAFVGDDLKLHMIGGSGLDAGRRDVGTLTPDMLAEVIGAGSRYLGSQVQADGRFHYGWHPCFDREIKAYNSLRHASSLYAMLEAWEVTRDAALGAAIDRALAYLTDQLIQPGGDDGSEMAFLIDPGNEIKLGGNAVAILALVKHAQLRRTETHRPLMDRLAAGILFMQDRESGRFRHVLHHPSLATKQDFRIIYYEGEAAFALMRLHGLTGDPRWLDAVERAFGHFIAERHWTAHDHWLGYCVNELTKVRADPAYYQFGIDNIAGYLDFVLERITTFPTLLELMMAAEAMIARLRDDPALAPMLARIDLGKFYRAMHHRAHYLMNGHFWPELAMFYAKPDRIAGSFFIRHHGFRVRIDDVEHYLSGLIAYRKYLLARGDMAETFEEPAHWTADHVARATGGKWIVDPTPGWRATGLCVYAPTFEPGDMVAIRDAAEKGVPAARAARIAPRPAAFITSNPADAPEGAPVLLVADSGAAILALGRYARARSSAKVIGITGSAGKTTAVAMMAHALEPLGAVGQTRHNANLPHGIAWNLASIAWDVPHIVMELAIGRMDRNTRMVRPDVAIFTNILPAHLEYHGDLETIAERKSRIFLGMAPGSVAILNRQMQHWEQVHAAAEARGIRVVHYGTSEDCEYRLLDYDAPTRTVTARLGERDAVYVLAAPGEHMALNSLAALAALAAMGHNPHDFIDRVASFLPVAGRGEEHDIRIGGQRLTLIDEAYNANPGSMSAALALMKAKPGRRVAVLGEMLELGPEAAAYHAALLPLIEENGIDRVHAVGALYDDFWSRLDPARRGLRAATPEELRPLLRADLIDGDTVLIKGSHGSRVHELVDWLKTGAHSLPPHISAMLCDIETGDILYAQNETALHPPLSLTKLLTLSLIDDRLGERGMSGEEPVTISEVAADVNSRWGFSAGETVPIAELMIAAMVVSANEAANALAEWHSGSQAAFTAALNARSTELGINARFASPSGLGRQQHISAADMMRLALHVIGRHPKIAEYGSRSSYRWGAKSQPSTNRLLGRDGRVTGLKTGSLVKLCYNLVCSFENVGQRRLAVILGARSKDERDLATTVLIEEAYQRNDHNKCYQ